MAEIIQKLKTPSVPSFIFMEMPVGRKQDGFTEAPKISIADLSNETLEEIASDWKFELLRTADRLRKNKKLESK